MDCLRNKSGMKIDILIVYEHKVRELESALLLKQKLEDKGFIVKIVQMFWDEGLAHLKFQPKCIVVPWCYDNNNLDYFLKYKSNNMKGIKIINLHCEQISNSNALKLMIPSGLAKNVIHCAWGKYFKDLLIDNGIEQNLIQITGSPRLDFFRNENSVISKSKKELSLKYNLSLNKKWILIIGNFSYAECSKPDTKLIEAQGYKNFSEMVEIATKTYNEIIEWIRLFLDRDNALQEKFEIIYRPHPSELISDDLKCIDENNQNFHVIREYAIRDWIVNSDLCFAWCSTSAVEAAFAQIPIYNLRPFEIPKEFQFPLLENIEQITDFKSFVNAIREYEKKMDLNYEFKKTLKYYYSIEDKTTAEIMTNFITTSIDLPFGYFEDKYSSAFALEKTINYLVKRLFYIIFGPNAFQGKYKKILNGYVSKKDMKDIEAKIKKIK